MKLLTNFVVHEKLIKLLAQVKSIFVLTEHSNIT